MICAAARKIKSPLGYVSLLQGLKVRGAPTSLFARVLLTSYG